MSDMPVATTTSVETRTSRPRRYLMARPTYYVVEYRINPWMHPEISTDVNLALAQWQRLHDVYVDLGFDVDVIEGLPDLPDMVYAANGALVVDGMAVAANFTYPQRAPEAPAYAEWLRQAGFAVYEPVETNEGEGDILLVGDTLLAGTGFRTSRAAHAEIAQATGHEVVSLELVDDHYYHLDTALAVLTDDLIAYYPPAFSAAAREELERRYPDAVIATADDAAVLGLNMVSDGGRAIMAPAAHNLIGQVRERGFDVLTVDTSELLKGGGGIKCCTLELRG